MEQNHKITKLKHRDNRFYAMLDIQDYIKQKIENFYKGKLRIGHIKTLLCCWQYSISNSTGIVCKAVQ